jgi:hypothetical protein
MVSRVCRELGGTSELIVFNDEAHHCYRGRFDHPDADATRRPTASAKSSTISCSPASAPKSSMPGRTCGPTICLGCPYGAVPAIGAI